LHATVCVLLWRLLSAWLPPAGAMFGALWFAVQPVHVEAVASAVGQTELMACAFVLAACLAHRDGSRIAPLWFALALLCKESGIVFLGLAFLIPTPRRTLYPRYFIVAGLYAACLGLLFTSQSIRNIAPTWTGASVSARWLTMLGLVPDYLRLMVAPLVLRTDYGPQVTQLATKITPTTVLGALLLILLTVLAATTRKKTPVILFGLAWFAIAIAPVANVFFASGVVLAERTMYLPSVGAAVIAGWLLAQLPRRSVALAGLGVGALAVRTWTRTPVWHDNFALTVAALHDSPASYKAHHAAGVFFGEAGHWPEAAAEYRLARQLFPLDGDPYRGGAEAALVAHDYATAAALLDSARQLGPTQIEPWLRGADVRMMQGRWRDAEALAFGAYELQPDSTRAIAMVISAAVRAGDVKAAAAAVKRGLTDHPGDERLRRESLYVARLKHP
jgi:protein O-mannosyl-transferase